MNRDEIIDALPQLGIETSDAQTDEELLALLDAATSADTAVEAAGDAVDELTAVLDDAADALIGSDETVDANPPAVDDGPVADEPPPTAPKGRAGKSSAPEFVTCVLGPNSVVGGLMVGNARIEAKRSGIIPRSEFERLQADYDLREVGD